MCRFPASGSSRESFARGGVDDTIRDSLARKSRRCPIVSVLASSAIRCRFVHRFVVCETQSSLPCCPSAVLSSRRPPSLGWVPVSPVPQRRQYYEGATTSHPRTPVTYLFRFRGPRDPSLLRARCCQRSRADGGSDRARTIVQPAVLFAGALSRGREWDLSGSQATHPVPLPRSKTPAEPTFPRQ